MIEIEFPDGARLIRPNMSESVQAKVSGEPLVAACARVAAALAAMRPTDHASQLQVGTRLTSAQRNDPAANEVPRDLR